MLSKKKGVLNGIAVGAFIAIVCLVGSIVNNPFHYQDNMSLASRLMVLSKSMLVLAVFLCIAVGRLAKDRFFNLKDIDGSGLSAGSQRANVLQALL